MTSDMKINKMYSFSQSPNIRTPMPSHKKTRKKVWGEIFLFFFELVLAFLPMLAVLIISTFVEASDFSFTVFLIDGEMLWFSITILAILNFKTIFSQQKRGKEWKLLIALTLISLLLFSGAFTFLKLIDSKIILLELNVINTSAFVILSTVVAVIVNIAAIVFKED